MLTKKLQKLTLIKFKSLAVLAVILGYITIGHPIYAQQTIGGGAPHPGAVLDVKSPTTTNFKGGLLIPGGILQSATDISVFSNPGVISDGILYFNRIGSSTMPKGLYYWDSTGVNTGSWKPASNMNVDSVFNIVKGHADSLTADKFIMVTGGDSSVLKRVKLRLDVVAIAKDSLFDSTLAHYNYFTKQLVSDSAFDTMLAKDTLFSHTLAHDTSFINTLTKDTAFVNSLSKDSVLTKIVRQSATQLYGNMAVVMDNDYTVVDSNYTIVMRSMTTNRTLNLPDPAKSSGRLLNIVQTQYLSAGNPVVLYFNYPVLYSDAVSLSYLDTSNYGGNGGSLKLTLQSDGVSWYVISTLY